MNNTATKTLTNARKALIYCKFLALVQAQNGKVDTVSFCETYGITERQLFTEVMLSNVSVMNICENVGIFDNFEKFANYYGLSVQDANFLMSSYRTNDLLIR